MQCSFFPRRHLAFYRPGSLQLQERGSSLCAHARKGFGKKAEGRPVNKDKATKQKKASKHQLGNSAQPAQPTAKPFKAQIVPTNGQITAETESAPELDNKEFERRLAELRQKGRSREAEQVRAVAQGGGVLGGPPPPLQATPPKRKEEDKSGSFGLVPQVAVGAISLALVGVLVLTSIGDSPAPPSKQDLSEEQLKVLKNEAGRVEQKLKEDPKDVASLRDLSSLSAALGDPKKSRSLAEQLVKLDAEDYRSWLALAEARLRMADYRGAATAYEKSIAVSQAPALDQLQGLAGALVGDKRPGEAVQKLQSYESQAAAGTSGAVGPVELQLLIGKVYSQWDKHFASALAVYDGLIEKFPDDFRGYLAKGALLKQNGRKGDAQRMFIKARFLAPPELQAVVDSLSNR